ncbi:MAG TPA: septal ring lytic transglycosylase RlpA family protein [Deltaproteobacteria bacterium]|nr:septal ring lytic transglycosylase RlpA family protein [Deltaproteobacteria bacterium]
MEQLLKRVLNRFEIDGRTICCSVLVGFLCFACSKTVIPPAPSQKTKPYKVFGKWYHPLPDSAGFRQRGIASWYGKDFHGKKTSNGEVYDMNAMTAAHKTLPLGTHVRVRHLENNREIEVRINDRGPFVRGRVIDLTYTGANKLGIVGPGTAPVEVVALGASVWDGASKRKYVPLDYYKGTFTIQVGAFGNRENAERLKLKLGENYKDIQISTYNKGSEVLYRVRVGKFNNLNDAEKNETLLLNSGLKDAFTVAE